MTQLRLAMGLSVAVADYNYCDFMKTQRGVSNGRPNRGARQAAELNLAHSNPMGRDWISWYHGNILWINDLFSVGS